MCAAIASEAASRRATCAKPETGDTASASCKRALLRIRSPGATSHSYHRPRWAASSTPPVARVVTVTSLASARDRAPLSAWHLRALLGLIGAVSFALAALPPVIVPDSGGYVRGAIFRSPVVPDLLFLCGARSGSAASLHLFVFLQAVLGFSAAAWLARELTSRIAEQRGWPLAFVLLGVPQFQAARTVGSESVAYALLCVTLVYACRLALGDPRRRDLAMLFLTTGLLVETRTQFAFLWPLAGMAALVFVTKIDASRRSRVTTLGSCSAALLAIFVLQGVYTIPRTGSVRGVPFTGIQLVSVLLHVSTPDDLALVQDREAREYGLAVRRDLEKDGLLASQSLALPPEYHYSLSYAETVHCCLARYEHDNLHRSPTSAPRDDYTPDEWFEYDRLSLRLSMELMRSEWRRYARVVLASILSVRAFVAVNLLLAFVGVVGLFRTRGASRVAAIAALAGGLWLGNAFVVALVEPLQTRYTFYFDDLTLTVLAILLGNAVFQRPRSDAGSSNFAPT